MEKCGKYSRLHGVNKDQGGMVAIQILPRLVLSHIYVYTYYIIILLTYQQKLILGIRFLINIMYIYISMKINDV